MKRSFTYFCVQSLVVPGGLYLGLLTANHLALPACGCPKPYRPVAQLTYAATVLAREEDNSYLALFATSSSFFIFGGYFLVKFWTNIK